MRVFITGSILVISLFYSGFGNAVTGGGDVGVLVGTEWLAERIDDPATVILHIGKMEDYGKEHIPGARPFSLRAIITDIPGGFGHELPPVSHIDSLIESAGISDDSRVVICYGDEIAATLIGRVYMTFEYMGHGDNTFVLDGGFPLWKNEKRPVTGETTEIERGGFTPHVRDDIIVDKKWIIDRLADPRMVIIDTRPEEAYTGAFKDPRWTRHGHLPGSFNIPFTAVMTDEKPPRFKDRTEMEKLFAGCGAGPGSIIVPYCDTGVWSGQVYIAAKHLGYDVRFYDASFQEWSADESLEVIGQVKIKAKR